MKRLAAILMAFFLVLMPAVAANTTAPLPDTNRLPGVDLADGISQITGTAVSPMLGVSVVGAWQYFGTPKAQRADLPWFTSPFVWGTGFFILLACLAGRLVSRPVPILREIVKVADTMEDKVSALLVSTTFVPFIAIQMAQHAPPDPIVVAASLQMASSFDFGSIDWRFVTVPLAIIGFAVVWIASHAINVLIMLSPFAVVDAALRATKGLILLMIVSTSFISPILGMAVCLLVIYVSWLIAPWAFRLTVFGSLLSFDILWPWHGRKNLRVKEPHAFLAKPIGNVAVRTYGHIMRAEDGSTAFVYRPWLVLPKRVIAIPADNVCLGKGLLFPSLLNFHGEKQKYLEVVMFLPRYRRNEGLVAAHFEIQEIRENILVRGFQSIRAWIREVLSFRGARRPPDPEFRG